MKKELNFYSDKDVQLILGTLLRVGVMVSMIVIFAGGTLYLFGRYSEVIDYRVFDPHKTGLTSIASVYKGVVHLDGSAITQFGVLLLIFTPVARVVFSVFSFLVERDYLYVLIGLLVLAIILVSLSNKLVG